MEKEALRIKLPVLMVHAAEDRIGSLAAGLEFINRCGSLDQTHVSFSGAWYGTLN
jgi:alpha-beta hydrolase superfamily lysophospholipase